MNKTAAYLFLLLVLAAGCDTGEDPADPLPDAPRELTDGFCLVSGRQVLLNHQDIEYYDYGAHVIYLKPSVTNAGFVDEVGGLSVYAGRAEIYALSMQPAYSSYLPEGPLIWTNPVFYQENILGIDWLRTYEERLLDEDPREDPRIVDALKAYGQYREGLHCELFSVSYESAQDVSVELKLFNGDPVDYYYLDPAKMGQELFHYFTLGLEIWDEERQTTYHHREEDAEPDPWDSFDLAWMSLLESGASTTMSIHYHRFQVVPPGSYQVFFNFPGLSYQVGREDLEQAQGRIWLGELQLHGEVVVEEDWGI